MHTLLAQRSLQDPVMDPAKEVVASELIIKYRPLIEARAPLQGAEITEEHQRFLTALQQAYSLPIREVRPVYQGLVDQMILENHSEREIQIQTFKNRQLRGSLSIRNAEDLPERNLSRSLTLFLEGKDAPYWENILESSADRMTSLGWVITEVDVEGQSGPAMDGTTDPLYPQQWSHVVTLAEEAWNVQTGDASVVIGIIDSGVHLSHEDLVDNLIPGFDFVDIPDGELEEWQLVDGEDYRGRDTRPTDFEGHGTHVAGIAAARRNNDLGVSGVCPNCAIMPLRTGVSYLDVEEGDTVLNNFHRHSDLADAIVYATNEGVDIINLSLGGKTRWSPVHKDALEYAYDNGVVIIAAAGNDGSSRQFYPAAFPEVISVANTENDDAKAESSNYGSWIDVAAPGSGIVSTVPRNSSMGFLVFTDLGYNNVELAGRMVTFSGFTTQEGITAPVGYIGLARDTDESNTDYDWDLNGKIALIQRGEITFQEKVERAKAFGAVGAIIFNNVDDGLNWTLGETQNNPIPVMAISRQSGEAMRLVWQSGDPVTAFMRVEGYPGYSIATGTSMSAPYVTGMAGLILSQFPGLSPKEVKDRILASTDDIDALNPLYNGQLGAGRVNLSKLFGKGTSTPLEENLDEASAIRLFPNPVQDLLTVELPQTGSGEMFLHNTLGQTMYRSSFSHQQVLRVPTEDLVSGVYFLTVQQGDEKIIKRVIKG